MNKLGLCLALLSLITSTPVLAADCLSPIPVLANSGMSLVAPEMLRPLIPDPFCLSAQDAIARIRAQAAVLASGASGAYVPLTKDDNTPWRFDMSQNGKRMTSVEFDAWMKAKGIRVATGKPGTTSVPEGPATSVPAESGQ